MSAFLDYITIDKRSTLYKKCIDILAHKEDIVNYMLDLSEVEKVAAEKAEKARVNKGKRDNKDFIDSLSNEYLNGILSERQIAFNTDDKDYYKLAISV